MFCFELDCFTQFYRS